MALLDSVLVNYHGNSFVPSRWECILWSPFLARKIGKVYGLSQMEGYKGKAIKKAVEVVSQCAVSPPKKITYPMGISSGHFG